MKASVSLKGEFSKPFEVGKSALFSVFLSMVLFDSITDSAQGLWTEIAPGLNLLNANQFESARKISNILVHELMFTDRTAFEAYNH